MKDPSSTDKTVSSPTLPIREVAVVVEQHEEAPGYYRLRLSAPEIAARAQAGQFVHVLPRAGAPNAASLNFDPLLRRAFSIMSVKYGEIEVLYRAGGRGTTLMARWRTGDYVDTLGPLGSGFGAFTTHNVLVGGGVGVPPMVMLAARPNSQDAPKSHLAALIGARSGVDVLCLRDFAALGISAEIATEDGSMGEMGRVTLLLDKQLTTLSSTQTKVFACGPLPMLRAVAKLCAQYSVDCEVSLEEVMPCGVGVCNGCVVPVVTASDDYGSYRRICVEGPVINAREVDWERL